MVVECLRSSVESSVSPWPTVDNSPLDADFERLNLLLKLSKIV